MTINFTVSVTSSENTALTCYLAGMGIASATPLLSGKPTTISFTPDSHYLDNYEPGMLMPINVIISDINHRSYFDSMTLWYYSNKRINYQMAINADYSGLPPADIQFSAIGIDATTVSCTITGTITTGNFK